MNFRLFLAAMAACFCMMFGTPVWAQQSEASVIPTPVTVQAASLEADQVYGPQSQAVPYTVSIVVEEPQPMLLEENEDSLLSEYGLSDEMSFLLSGPDEEGARELFSLAPIATNIVVAQKVNTQPLPSLPKKHFKRKLARASTVPVLPPVPYRKSTPKRRQKITQASQQSLDAWYQQENHQEEPQFLEEDRKRAVVEERAEAQAQKQIHEDAQHYAALERAEKAKEEKTYQLWIGRLQIILMLLLPTLLGLGALWAASCSRPKQVVQRFLSR